MKKIFILLLMVLILLGCESNEEKVDYSKYKFTDVSWIRDSGHDIETITFNSDGTFGYSCACGNPVNNADVCETYSYNDKTKTIKLYCDEPGEDTITEIKIINSSNTTLELDFDGEIRTFSSEE